MLRCLHAIDARRLQERRFDFEAVRTASSDRDAPRRLFEKWDLENGVINRRLKAEADEKDRYVRRPLFFFD